MGTRRDAAVAASLAALALPSGRAGAQRPTASPPAAAAALGTLQGVVYDSLGRRPLAGATVQSVRAGDAAERGGRAVTTDSAGRFRIDSLAPGRYVVGFSHPLLDLLRVEPSPWLVDIGPGDDTAHVDLAVPDLARVRPVVCGSEQAPNDSSGLVVGRVRDADGSLVANATVVFTWTERALDERGLRTERRRLPVTTRPGGSFVVCGAPEGEELVASAAAPGRASGEVALTVPTRGLVVRDLTVGDTASVATAPEGGDVRRKGDAAPPVAVRRGTARLTGTVRDSSGRPVRGARASVRGTAAEATAGAEGTFALGALPAGSATLEVRAIGYVLRQLPIELASDRAISVDVKLDRVANLAPVTVYGTPTPPSMYVRDFLDRRARGGFGRFITAEEIARRKPLDVSDMLRAMPGLQIDRDGPFRKRVLGRGGPYGPCNATIVLDGMVLPSNEDLDRWIGPESVGGIEVYADGTFAPPQYASATRSFCSVVLVWSR